MTNIPLYQSHKRVRAARIEYWSSLGVEGDGSETIKLQLAGGLFVLEGSDWVSRFKPKPDENLGYYVVYDDGYASWSPSAAFEAGYTRITESTDPAALAEPNAQRVRDIARIAHEVNRAYCESVGDSSQVPWVQATPNIQQSVVHGVLFAIMHPEATPRDQHLQWCEFKLRDGWVWGLEKSAELKTHPCLVEYEDLPKEQQIKDTLFQAVVRAAL